MKPCSALTVALFVVTAGVRLFAEAGSLPDNNQVRLQLSDIIFAPTFEVLSSSPAIYPNPSQGTPVRFDVMQQNGDFYLLFMNKDGSGFPIDSAGSYIIKRKDRNGDFVQVKIFLKDGPGSFVRIFPMGERASMDVYLYGYPMYHDVVIPIPFKQILTDSFSRVMDLTRASVDWTLIFPNRPLPEDRLIEGLAGRIEKLLPHQPSPNDGGVGLARWIIDGLIAAQTGNIPVVRPLSTETVALNPNQAINALETHRASTFSLDWARSLATAAARVDFPGAGLTSSDVTDVPFFRYAPNVGYPAADLKFVLYELAVANPGYFYLGAVSVGQGSSQREYGDLVVLFPYFDEFGRFEVYVAGQSLKTGIDSLEQRHHGAFVQLEQVAASSDFSSPETAAVGPQ